MQLAFSNKVKISDASPRTAPVSTTHRVPLPPLPPPLPPGHAERVGRGAGERKTGGLPPPVGRNASEFPEQARSEAEWQN